MEAIETVQQWDAVISDLAAKRQAMLDRLEELRGQKHALALEASLGGVDARKRLERVNAELGRLALDIDAVEVAGAEAERLKREAERIETAEAERLRRQQVSESLRLYADNVRMIDDLLRLLAARFATARQNLERGESLMTAQECAPLQQLHSLWGPTLAAAHCGLADYMSFGREAAHAGAHGQPLEQFTRPYLEPWTATPAETVKE